MQLPTERLLVVDMCSCIYAANLLYAMTPIIPKVVCPSLTIYKVFVLINILTMIKVMECIKSNNTIAKV